MTLRASHVCFLHRRPLGVASSRNENVESSIAATVPQKLRPNFDISVASLHKVRVFISHQRMHTSPFPLASACNCKQPRTSHATIRHLTSSSCHTLNSLKTTNIAIPDICGSDVLATTHQYPLKRRRVTCAKPPSQRPSQHRPSCPNDPNGDRQKSKNDTGGPSDSSRLLDY